MIPDRLTEKIDATGSCWQWVAYRDKHGYGKFRWEGGVRYAHRVIWQVLVGPIPDGLQLDHLCRNPSCCNPDHLEPVTHAENLRRGVSRFNAPKGPQTTHCPYGHKKTQSGARWRCLTCHAERERVRYRNHHNRPKPPKGK